MGVTSMDVHEIAGDFAKQKPGRPLKKHKDAFTKGNTLKDEFAGNLNGSPVCRVIPFLYI
jgi:hypothetical protein